MKLHSLFRLNAARVLTVLAMAALTASAVLLTVMPVRAAAATTSALQCQVSTQVGSSGLSYAIVCNGSLPDGSVTLDCQSPNAISDNNGVYTVAGSCSGTVALAGASIPITVNGTAIAINANNGSITAASGAVTAGLNAGLASATASCSGAALSETLSPLTINNPGTCSVATSLLGLGTAQVTATGGSTVNVSNSPNPVITINSPSFTASASLLGLINVSTTCGTSVAINLNQLFPITIPAPCSGL